jgi:hypothetical protein
VRQVAPALLPLHSPLLAEVPHTTGIAQSEESHKEGRGILALVSCCVTVLVALVERRTEKNRTRSRILDPTTT